MILFHAEHDARKRAVFSAIAQAAGLPSRQVWLRLSFRDWPETASRVQAALDRAKRRPGSGPAAWLKRQLLRGQYNWARAHFTRHPGHVAVAWNGLGGGRGAFLQGARDAGAATLHAELAPLPGRITLDAAGVNAEGSVPQEAAFFTAWAGAEPQRRGEGWRALGAQMVARPSRRADVGQGTGGDLPRTPFLFLPLQVPDDSQVTLFSGWCGGMDGFLSALAAALPHLPEGWHLRIKEHPSAKRSLADDLAPLLRSGRAVLDNASDSFAQVAASRGVVTLNSSMGLQAFFHDRPVIVLGRAFYALPGLVTPADSPAALRAAFADPAALTFDPALRAAFMNWLDQVYYPRFDWPGGTADLAALAERIAAARNNATPGR